MQHDLRVGSWLAQPSLGRLSRSGLTVQVRPKVMDLLVYLAQHPGEVVSKDVLLRDVWGTDAVSESALTRTIAELRQALGDDVEQPSILETIPKRGYRLIAPVTSEADAEARVGGGRRRAWLWALAGLIALFIAGGAWMALSGSLEPHEPMRHRQVTRLEGVESSPSLSPDGSQVAFIWNNDLYVKAVDSDVPKPIARGVFETAWSPDGQWIATYRDVGPPGHLKLLLVPPTGGSEREIGSFRNGGFRSLAWSPDGDWIALSHVEATAAVFLVSIRTHERRRISTPPPEAVFDGHPTFSNDGRRLAFFRKFGGSGIARFEIHTVGVDGAGDHTVATLQGMPIGLGWTSDDRGLVLAMQTPENLAGLWRVPIDGGTPKPYEVGENAWRFSIAGDRLVYQQLVYNTKVLRASGPLAPVKEAPRPFRPGGRNDSVPRYSPDGRRVVFVSAGRVWVCQSDGTDCGPLTYQGQAKEPTWSPTGDSIAFVDSQRNIDLYIVNASGGVPRQLTNDIAPDGTPGFSRDGRWVYFNSKQTSEFGIWRVPVSGGTPEQVSSIGGNHPNQASDGWFYMARGNLGTIERMRPDGSRRHILKGGLPTLVSWTLWGDMPLVRKGDVIFKLNPKTQRLSEFWRLDLRSLNQADGRDGACNRFDVSPDGRWIVYCEANPQSDLILVENFR